MWAQGWVEFPGDLHALAVAVSRTRGGADTCRRGWGSSGGSAGLLGPNLAPSKRLLPALAEPGALRV